MFKQVLVSEFEGPEIVVDIQLVIFGVEVQDFKQTREKFRTLVITFFYQRVELHRFEYLLNQF